MTDKGIPIRVVVRTMDILMSVNRGSPKTLMEISKSCGLPYPTTYRIVQSLAQIGIVRQEPISKTYMPTALSKSLSYGYQTEHAFAALAQPYLIELTEKIGWPVCTSARASDSMVILDSTHSMTMMKFSQNYPGFAMPIWSTSAGKVLLSFCDDQEREGLLKMAAKFETEGQEMKDFGERLIHLMIEQVQSDGYATISRNQYSKDPGKTSSISVPLYNQGKFMVPLTCIFFSSTMYTDQAVEKYLPDMINTQKLINKISLADV